MRFRWLIPLLLVFALAACRGDSTPQEPTRVVLEVTPEAAAETPLAAETLTPTPLPSATPLPIPQTVASSSELQSYLRFIHASYTIDPVDIYIDGLALGLALDYTNITQPAGIVAGNYTAYAFHTGQSFATNSAPIASLPVSITPGQTLTVILGGSNDAPTLNALPEIDAPLPMNMSRVNLIHALTDEEQIRLQQNGADIATAIAYGEQTIPVDLPGEPIILNVVDETGAVLATYNDTPPTLNRLTLVLTGDIRAPDGIQLLSFQERVPGIALIRAINVSDDVPSVDIYLNQEPFFPTIGYGQSSPQRELGANTYTADVYPAGSDPATIAPLTSRQFNLNEGENLSVIIAGTADNLRLIRYREDVTPTPSNAFRIAFIHARPDMGRLTIAELAEEVDSLDYTQMSESLVIPAGTLSFTWVTNDAERTTVQAIPDSVFEAGYTYLYILAGQSEQDALLFSTPIGVNETSVELVDSEPTLIPELPSRIYFVNMIDSREPLDTYIDENPVYLGMAHAQASPPLIIAKGVHTISIRQPGIPTPEPSVAAPTASDLVTLGYEFSEATSYTVYAVGLGYTDVRLIVEETAYITSQPSGMATVRLVNFGNKTETRFGLALRRTALGPPELVTDPEITMPPFRDPYIGASQTIVNRIGSMELSDAVEITPDTYTVLIFESSNGYTAKIEYDFVMEANRHYDFIIQELPNGAVNLFIAPYN